MSASKDGKIAADLAKQEPRLTLTDLVKQPKDELPKKAYLNVWRMRIDSFIRDLDDLGKLRLDLTPFDSSRQFDQLRQRYVAGTRRLLCQEFEAWANSPRSSSRVFWLCDTPGMGKSVMFAHLAFVCKKVVNAVRRWARLKTM